jgi:hypothetical protein
MSAECTADDCRAALEAAGWGTTFRILFHPRGRAWVASAVKGGRSVEGRGDSAREAWEMVCREVFKGGGP